MTRIFITKNFGRWADSEGLTDEELKEAVTEMDDGLIDANLGGAQSLRKELASMARERVLAFER